MSVFLPRQELVRREKLSDEFKWKRWQQEGVSGCHRLRWGGGLKIHSPLPTAVNQSFVAPKKQYGIQHRSDGGGRGGQKEKEREGSNSSEPPPTLESAKG